MNKRKILREYLAGNESLIAPGAYDVLSAKIIQRAGFSIAYVTGFGTAASMLGVPDYGLMTMTEILETSRRIAHAVDIPIVADGDTGYGNPLNVFRTVKEYEEAGLAGIQLEDQVFPKRCGHMLGKHVIAVSEQVEKIRAAFEARMDPDFVIIARTDARAPLGLDQAISRAKAYVAAGADAIFVEAPQSVDELRKVADEIDVPLVANMVENGITPLLSKEELNNMGYKIIIYPVLALFAASMAMTRALQELNIQGTSSGIIKDLTTFQDFTDLIGLPFYKELESKFS